jgi:uncharacterized protein (UPF0254 family)
MTRVVAAALSMPHDVLNIATLWAQSRRDCTGREVSVESVAGAGNGRIEAPAFARGDRVRLISSQLDKVDAGLTGAVKERPPAHGACQAPYGLREARSAYAM